MAADFHELSPYVLIGNPLTLAVIEFFAVPCALVGAALYPVGLDGVAWRWLHMGIDLVVWLARGIADAPGASLSVPAFAPWAPPFFTLAVLSAVLWRSWTLRATALPFLLLGLLGATRGAPFDIAVPPAGDAIALRLASGALTLVGKKPGSFAAEQWLRADADPRAPAAARTGGETACDDLGCVARAQDGRLVALALASGAFVEDCARAAIIVTPLRAPSGCAAPVVIDRRALIETGAVSLRLGPGDEVTWTRARAIDEDRPWSPRPPPAPRAGAMGEEKDDEAATLSEPLD
jgi:competence protein ComEC